MPSQPSSVQESAGIDLIVLLQFAAPVALAALGELVVQKSGVINVGLEGAMLSAAFFGMLGSYFSHSAYIGLGSALIAATATCAVFGLFTIVCGCDQVVVGTAINLLALGMTGTLYRRIFGQSGALLSVSRIPSWRGVDPIMAVMLASPVLIWMLLIRTGWGLAARAAGEYPPAVAASGFSVKGLRIQALGVGSIFAGLGGAYLSLLVTGSFSENITAGRGFIALAMVTFGRWRPWPVLAASIVIGLAGSLQFRLQTLGWNLPYQLFIALPYLLVLAVLLVAGKGPQGPSALGKPFDG